MKKRIFSWLVAVAMVMSMLPTAAFATGTEATQVNLAQGSYTITEPGEYTVTSYTGANTLTVKADATVTLQNVNITAAADASAISIESGNVTLNVAADSTLTGGDNGAGIYVAETASITIKGSGTLTATGNTGTDDASGAAGIGGTAANGNSGAITIDGATIVAKGYGIHGSGIGSGSGKVVGEIKIINNANITAQGGYYSEGGKLPAGDKYGSSLPEGGAAIGGGGKTTSTVAPITIAGSTVIAYGGSKAAGIGANFWCSAEKIDIDGSTVTAYGGVSSAGIGTSRAGSNGVSATIEITDSTVNATGGDHGAGIGGGYNGDSLSNLPTTTITIDGTSDVTATGQNGGAGIGGGYKTNNLSITIADTAKVNATASLLNDGSNKTIAQTSACAIGSGANGSGSFAGSTITIADTAKVTANGYEVMGGKDDIEGQMNNKSYVEWIKAELLQGNDVILDRDIVVDGTYVDSIPAATNGNGRYPNYGIFNVVGEYGDGVVTFDLNGHTITYNGHTDFQWNDKTVSSCTVAHGLFFANNGANLTIKDSSADKSGEVMVYGMASGVYSASPNSVITVEGGTWKNEGCATCGGTNLFLYASHGGELYIENGRFEQALDSNGDSYLIVEHGGEYKNAVIDFAKTKIEISGGTFVGMNPETAVKAIQDVNNKLSWDTTNVVADGYFVRGNDPYTVVNTYLVSFNRNGGTGTMETVNVGRNSTYTLPANGFAAPQGKEFASWKIDGITYAVGETYTVSCDTVVYAQWKDIAVDPVTYTVTFNANGGSAVPSQTVNENATASQPATPTYSGRTFLGWYLDGVLYDFTTPVTGDITLTAYWSSRNSGASGGSGSATIRPAVKDELPFTDVDEDDWFYDPVKYVYEHDIMAGTGKTIFDPDVELSRAMIAQVLYNLDKDSYADIASVFTDVTSGDWFYDAVTWAAAEGVVAGYGNGLFGSLDDVTREQLAMILYNYAVSKDYKISGTANLGMYTDADQISGWATNAVSWAVANNLLFSTNGLLTPTAPATRAEIAYAMMNFCENIMK